MTIRETFLKAHEATKKIKKEFVEVDYRTQFGICLSYLLKNKEETEMMKEVRFEKKGMPVVVRLNGTELEVEINEVIARVRAIDHSRAGWCYMTTDRKIMKMFGAKGQLGLTHESAKEMYNLQKQAEEEEMRAKKAKKEAEKEAIRNGEKKIKVSYYDGEYLSGYSVYGLEAELLEELGLCKYVSGWGNHVNHDLIKTVGEEFTYAQAKAFAQPELDRKAEEKAQKQTKIAAKFEQAKAMGEPVELRRYTTDCNDPREECDTDVVYEYAMPDGTIKTKRQHTW
jgi:hypothetical protein